MEEGRITASSFDLDITLTSGQVFGWKKIDGWWYGEIKGNAVRVKQDRNYLLFEGAERHAVSNYFALNEDVEAVYRRISKDGFVGEGVKELWGLRLLRQDPWVCTVSFVCSAFSNIPRIEKKLNNLRIKYGHGIEFKGHRIYLFPQPRELASAPLKKLRACGLGFRDKYVKELGKRMQKFDVYRLGAKDYETAKRELMESAGIGEKVADCICLFSLDKHEAFPIDIWIARIMKEKYGPEIKSLFPKTKFSYKDIQLFARKKWGNDAGYAQQFIYTYGRKHKLGKENV